MKLRSAAFAVLASGLFASQAHALTPVILTIDDSDPSAVKFTGTGEAPINADSDLPFNSGFTLEGFFSESENELDTIATSTMLTTGTSVGSGVTPLYDTAAPDGLVSSENPLGNTTALNIFDQ